MAPSGGGGWDGEIDDVGTVSLVEASAGHEASEGSDGQG